MLQYVHLGLKLFQGHANSYTTIVALKCVLLTSVLLNKVVVLIYMLHVGLHDVIIASGESVPKPSDVFG